MFLTEPFFSNERNRSAIVLEREDPVVFPTGFDWDVPVQTLFKTLKTDAKRCQGVRRSNVSRVGVCQNSTKTENSWKPMPTRLEPVFLQTFLCSSKVPGQYPGFPLSPATASRRWRWSGPTPMGWEPLTSRPSTGSSQTSTRSVSGTPQCWTVSTTAQRQSRQSSLIHGCSTR